MITTIVEDIENSKETNSFPRLWRNRKSGNIYLETREGSCRIHSDIGDEPSVIPNDHNFPAEVFERITTPITIRFEP